MRPNHFCSGFLGFLTSKNCDEPEGRATSNEKMNLVVNKFNHLLSTNEPNVIQHVPHMVRGECFAATSVVNETLYSQDRSDEFNLQ